MLEERLASQSEVIRAIVSDYSPCPVRRDGGGSVKQALLRQEGVHIQRSALLLLVLLLLLLLRLRLRLLLLLLPQPCTTA